MVNNKNKDFFPHQRLKFSLYGKEKDLRKNKTFVRVRVKYVAKKVFFYTPNGFYRCLWWIINLPSSSSGPRLLADISICRSTEDRQNRAWVFQYIVFLGKKTTRYL